MKALCKRSKSVFFDVGYVYNLQGKIDGVSFVERDDGIIEYYPAGMSTMYAMFELCDY